LYTLPPAVPSNPSTLAKRHDRASFTVDAGLFDHSGQCRFGDEERAGEVDRNHPFPFGEIEQMDRTAARDACGVDDAVEPVRHSGQHRRNRRFVGDIGCHEMEIGAEVGRRSHVGADNDATLCQQALGCSQTDAGGGTRHHERPRTSTISVHHDWSSRIACAAVRVRTGHRSGRARFARRPLPPSRR
jgi:hypothetical protein